MNLFKKKETKPKPKQETKPKPKPKPKPKTQTKVKDSFSNNIIGISFVKSEALQRIFKASGSLAVANEFQCHYSAFVITYQSEEQTVYIEFPLIYFNYPQEVTPAHINFDLPDVQDISSQLEPVAQLKAQQFVTDNQSILNQLDDMFMDKEITRSYSISLLNSNHKHPSH